MDDLISEFIAETSESLELLDSELVELEQNPNDQEILGNIFRLVHTIKGTCGFLGLPRLASVAHAGENVLGKIRDGDMAVTPPAISIVLEALDCIKGLIDHLSENGAEPIGDDTNLINRLNAFADGAHADITTEKPVAPVKPAAKPKPEPAPVATPETPSIASEAATTAEQGIEKDPDIAATEAMMANNPPPTPDALDEMDELERAFAAADSSFVPAVPQEFLEPSDDDASLEAETDDATNSTQDDTDDELTENENAQASLAEIASPLTQNIGAQAKATAIQQGMETPATGGKKEGGAMQSIRVNIDVLEDLMQMVGELVLTRNQLLQLTRDRDERELTSPLQQLSQITSELQEGIMKTRMQPISIAWSKFPRLVRDLAQDLNKKIHLEMIGETTEVDRQLLEAIKDPLTHMVRNSCDHGLETPEERIKAGKPEAGTVTLSAFHEGGYIIIKIADNGRGVNLGRVKQKAVENGLATPELLDGMSDEQIMQFIFKPGFSTAEKVTSVSGRGVGMDVVRTNIEKIGGAVSLSSVSGEGSTFHIKIPLTLAIVSVLIVQAGEQRFAIPQLNVAELVSLSDDSDYKIETVHGAPLLRLREKLIPMLSLSHVLGLTNKPLSEEDFQREDSNPMNQHYAVIIKVGASEFGVLVDRVHDTEEIVVKPASRVLENLQIYSGNTILGDGSVIMILDPNGLAKSVDVGDNTAKTEEEPSNRFKERHTTYLLFAGKDQAQKAVPLELVSRLEEIKAETIERTGSTPVVQYRDDLMQLKTLDGSPPADEGVLTTIVFSYDGRSIGLVVDHILDIVKAPIDIKISSENPLYMGGLVVAGKSTDILDVSHLIQTGLKTALRESAFTDTSALGELNLLFIEDSPFFRKMTLNYFNSIGMNATSATSGADGLRTMREATTVFDVIVTDIEMPEMDGFQFARHAHNIKNYHHVPIYAFTSTVNQETLDRAKEANMKGVINKTNRDELVDSLMHHLKQQKEMV